MPKPIRQFTCDHLPVEVYPTNAELGQAAAEQAIQTLRAAIAAKGYANVILATGNSQISLFAGLLADRALNWSKVNVFHMDEYIGITDQHPASFPRFLREKILDQAKPGSFYPVAGDAASLEHECARYAALLRRYPADVCCLGYGGKRPSRFQRPAVCRVPRPGVGQSGPPGRSQPQAASRRGPLPDAGRRPDACHHLDDPGVAGGQTDAVHRAGEA